MTSVTLSVASRGDVTRRAVAAFARWELLKAMSGQCPMTTREAARRAGRDVKAVHGHVQALLAAGVLERTADRRIVLPYDAVQVDSVLEAA